MKNILISKQFRTLITILFYVLAGLFIYIYIQRVDFSSLRDISINWWYIVASVPFSIFSRMFLPSIWMKIIGIYHKIEGSTEYWDLNYVYAKSWLGKYLPGKVAWVAGKIYFALNKGIDKTTLSIASFVDTVLQLLAALIIGVAFLFISGTSSNFSFWYNLFFLASTVIGLFIISPPILNRLLGFGYTLIKKRKLDKKYFLKFSDLFKIIPMYFFVYALSSIPIYLIIRSLGFDIGLIDLIYVSGAFIFAGAVGTIAVFAPSGLGVREGVLLLFLVQILPADISLVLVVFLRIWSIVLDLGYWILSWLILRVSRDSVSVS